MPSNQAAIVANLLVEADLQGHETHGTARLGLYIERVKNRAMNANPQIKIIQESISGAVLDGDHGFGQVVGLKAIEIAVQKAKRTGVGVVTVRNSGHLGALGLLAEVAAVQKMIGCILSNTSPIMAPWGGIEPVLGNNPFAVAVPRESNSNVVIDMALSNTARGKILLASREGRAIPEGWALDKEGEPTTNAAEALRGTVLPMAGHKGYAQALIVDILAGVLSGSCFGNKVGSLVPPDLNRPLGIGNFVLVLDICKYISWENFQDRLNAFLNDIKNSQLAKGSSEIIIPGEIKARTRAERMKNGLQLNQITLRELRGLSEEYKVKQTW